MSSLIVGIFAGAIGAGYFVYGRRQARFTPMLAGILLCVYPYFVDNLFWLCAIGIVLVVAPFLVDF